MQYQKYLNPLIRELDSVRDFSQEVPQDPLFSEELPHLERTVSTIAKDIDLFQDRLEKLDEEIEKAIRRIDTETGDDKSEAVGIYNKLMGLMEQLIIDTNRALESADTPYFGKIILDRDHSREYPAKVVETYIGRFAYFDKKSLETLVSDWRAPIANLYYEHSGPTKEVSYSTPVGEMSGELTQKRQFEMEKGRFHTIYDSKTGNATADAFLLSQLKKRIGKKLKDIVATIQAQQNEIIRDYVDRPVIIQGVAGSGKTTIVLHRLAYLFYAYRDKGSVNIRPEKSLIIAPNMMFLDYVSDVLPSLGVKGLEQNTFIFWARSLLGFSQKHILSHVEDNLDLMKLKGSLTFVKIIDRYFQEIEKEVFEKIPGGIAIDMEERYFELKEKHTNLSMLERLNLSLEYAFAQSQIREKRIGSFQWDLEKNEERKKSIRKIIKEYTDVYKLYKKLFSYRAAAEWGEIDKDTWEQFRIHSSKQLKGVDSKSNGYKVEDLAALVWLHIKIYGIEEFQKDCVVVDEAQDLSIFQLLTLTAIAKNRNITVAGDIAQSITPPFYISDWNQLIGAYKEVFPSAVESSYHQLFRSYRTTIEIIDYANSVFKNFFPASYKLPEAVLRHGDDVKIIQTENLLTAERKDNNLEGAANSVDYDNLVRLLRLEHENGASSVAVICKNEQAAQRVFNTLKVREKELQMELISFEDDNYQSGILVLPVSRAKGLEFDGVIILDLNQDVYTGSEHDVRLFYVAVTRALHRLYITYSQNEKISELIG